jgi:octaprenyl-diphosphate synthase
MSLSQNLETTHKQYMQVIKGKTATLFASACEVGGIISDADDNQVNALQLYGQALGISFQMVDDFLDYAGDKSDLGKNIGDDFREKKITLPIIFSLQNDNNDNHKFWKRTLAKGEQDVGDFETSQKLLKKDGSLEKTRQEALAWAEIAKSQLALLPKGEFNTLLLDLTDFIVARVS